MERKTKVNAETGRHDLMVTREFDLPLELLFKAHAEPEIIEQWMGTKVLKFEGRKHGSWQYETKDPQGNVAFQANGVFHDFTPNGRIVRTFEMENASFGVQLEFLEFVKLTEDTSKLNMHIVYRSVEDRDKQLQLPFAYGINMAHDRLENILSKLKQHS
ncbi:SRPBCC domain-containing protein [Chitinophaga sp. CF418]|uniref:SRPBCC domain-containing protein n=1 Tax=Chitinophaga sp. CF418 TaxID=1855287 RepID=UPI000921EB33|nr:SRPBCC domain-containing protein [Chitinophaga sp. CF418]SHN41166.1 Uncharacterized conserved protein YndB, AHSA1/START domain [Chitinophaga sp. CF418]